MAIFSDDTIEIDDFNRVYIDNMSEEGETPSNFIADDSVPEIVSTLLQNIGTELDEDVLARIDGLDYDGLLSILLAASQSIVLMKENQDDTEDDETFELAVRLQVAFTGHSEWKVRQDLEADPEARQRALVAARVAQDGDVNTSLEDEFAKDVLTYEQRWNPDPSKDWTANGNHGRFVFREGIWFHERMGRSVVYPHLHFGFLDEGYFPMLKG